MGWGCYFASYFYLRLGARYKAKGQPEHGNMPQETNLLLRLTLMTNTDGPSRDWPYVFSANFAAHPNLNTFQIGISPDAD